MIRVWTSVGLAACILGAALGAGCGAGRAGDQADAGAAVDASSSDTGQCFGCGDAQGQTLVIQPQNATLTANGPGATMQFQALVGGNVVQAQWSVDQPPIGTIDGSGLFSATGLLSGQVTIGAQSGSMHAQSLLTVKLQLTDNPGGLSQGTQGQLQGGGSADPSFEWLYPYDGTVFPRGLLSPTLQLGGTAADATYVHVSFSELDYKGFFGPSSPTQIALSPQLWKTMTESATGTDTVKIEVTKISGSQVTGPITESWRIAQGSLKGTVYYESRYSSASDNGATMRIQPGASAPDVLLDGCRVCHFVSADGSTLTATDSSGGLSASYDLTNNAALIHQEPDATFAFGALYPDGSILMASGGLAPSNTANSDWTPDLVGRVASAYPFASHLYDVKTGAQLAAPGWDSVISIGYMPSFSPDGKLIAFNHYDAGQGHSIAVMGFDRATLTFSNLVDVATDPTQSLAWPAFVPDGQYVVYNTDSGSDFGTWEAPQAGVTLDRKGDLGIAHVPSRTTASLDRLNGVLNGQYYLPFGESAEGHMNYDATVLPVAVGGYYWVVFTSRREYGNTINTSSPYYNGDPRSTGVPWRKKLWVAALDLDDPEHPATMARDISHPAFYLPGQDLETGNYRAFWALSPCQSNGSGCETGDQCCTGYCRQTNGDAGAVLQCVPPPQTCANEYEKCVTTADCCGKSAGYSCINGYCAQPAAQ